MTKAERLEDLGKINIMLKSLLDDYEILEHLDSKHAYETWCDVNFHRIEDDEPRGLYHIHWKLREIYDKLHDIYHISLGTVDDD